MYAIRNKETGKFVSGTDYRQSYGFSFGIGEFSKVQMIIYKQISNGSALTYADYWHAERDFFDRGCSSKLYKIVKVDLVEVDE